MKGLYLIPDKLNMQESVQLIKECNGAFEYNDFYTCEILEDKKKQLEIIESYAKIRTDFSKDTMHGAFLDVTVHSSDVRIKEVSELRVRQSMDIAKEMGLRGVVFHTNRLKDFRVDFYLKNWIETNEVFYRKICEEYPNQEIYMENMFDEAPDVLAEFAQRMKDVTNFGVCLDYAHATLSEIAPSEWMKQLAPYVKHMHINDNDLKNDLHSSVGEGLINWKQFKKEIEQFQIDASVLIEVSGLERQKKSLEYVKENHILSTF